MSSTFQIYSYQWTMTFDPSPATAEERALSSRSGASASQGRAGEERGGRGRGAQCPSLHELLVTLNKAARQLPRPRLLPLFPGLSSAPSQGLLRRGERRGNGQRSADSFRPTLAFGGAAVSSVVSCSMCQLLDHLSESEAWF